MVPSALKKQLAPMLQDGFCAKTFGFSALLGVISNAGMECFNAEN